MPGLNTNDSVAEDQNDPRQRLQRVLAARGVASRRKAEELIVEGRVRVDGQVVSELGTRVDPESQRIEVDGQLIPPPRFRYIALNKPSGYITTADDERGRRTVLELVDVPQRVVPVGRLDRKTEGLLLLTNDGELAYRITHPRYEIEKEYEAVLDGPITPPALERLRRGIVVDGERTVPRSVRPVKLTEDGTIVRIVIHEGRNRIVRRMFEAVGYPVTKLTRIRVGPLQLGAIPRGMWRDLTEGELEQIREATHMDDETFSPPSQPRERVPERRSTRPPGRPSRPGERYRGAGEPGRREERGRAVGQRESRAPGRTSRQDR